MKTKAFFRIVYEDQMSPNPYRIAFLSRRPPIKGIAQFLGFTHKFPCVKNDM